MEYNVVMEWSRVDSYTEIQRDGDGDGIERWTPPYNSQRALHTETLSVIWNPNPISTRRKMETICQSTWTWTELPLSAVNMRSDVFTCGGHLVVPRTRPTLHDDDTCVYKTPRVCLEALLCLLRRDGCRNKLFIVASINGEARASYLTKLWTLV